MQHEVQKYITIVQMADKPSHQAPTFADAQAWAREHGYKLEDPVISEEMELLIVQARRPRWAD